MMPVLRGRGRARRPQGVWPARGRRGRPGCPSSPVTIVRVDRAGSGIGPPRYRRYRRPTPSEGDQEPRRGAQPGVEALGHDVAGGVERDGPEQVHPHGMREAVTTSPRRSACRAVPSGSHRGTPRRPSCHGQARARERRPARRDAERRRHPGSRRSPAISEGITRCSRRPPLAAGGLRQGATRPEARGTGRRLGGARRLERWAVADVAGQAVSVGIARHAVLEPRRPDGG